VRKGLTAAALLALPASQQTTPAQPPAPAPRTAEAPALSPSAPESNAALTRSSAATATATAAPAAPKADRQQAVALAERELADLSDRGVLAGIKVKVKAIVAETGKTASYDEDATTAIKDTNQRLTVARRLLDCLNT
jgi:hypothetical protein